MGKKRDDMFSADEPTKIVDAPASGIRVLSMREGDIILAGGVILAHGKTLEIDRETADSLIAQFPAHVRIID